MNDSERIRKPHAFPGLDAELGPATPISDADAKWLVERIVERALEPEGKLRARPLRLRTLSLAAIVVVTSAAAASVVHQRFRRSDAVPAPAVSTPQRQTKKLPSARVIGRESESTEHAAAASAEPTSDALAPPRAREVTAPVTSAPGAIPSESEAIIVDELSLANDLRRKAQWQAAEAAYRAIASNYPQAQEATVAQLAAAELRLEHLGDAAGALRLYQSVRRGSALGLEALFGASRAYRALGNRDAEAAALRSLLDAYPTSLQADGARARLKELSTESAKP